MSIKSENLQKKAIALQITFMLENTRRTTHHQEKASIFQNISFIHIFGTHALHVCVIFLPACVIQVVKRM